MSDESSFFVTDGTVTRDAVSYVTRNADATLLSGLLAGEFCYVLNTRQMGKSSLAVRMLVALQEQGIKTAFLDLTRFGGQNVTAEHRISRQSSGTWACWQRRTVPSVYVASF